VEPVGSVHEPVRFPVPNCVYNFLSPPNRPVSPVYRPVFFVGTGVGAVWEPLPAPPFPPIWLSPACEAEATQPRQCRGEKVARMAQSYTRFGLWPRKRSRERIVF
jgi:hypothetical protein